MTKYIADLEADGFLEEATVVWCGVFKTLDGKKTVSFSPLDGKDYVAKMLAFMDTAKCLVFHNGYGYDFPLLKKLYNYEYRGIKEDTLVMSRLQVPKRKVPFNCPVKDRPHSVGTWGYRVGRGKPEHNDWSQFSLDMLHRCTEDVEIQRLTYFELEKEREGYDWSHAIPLTHKLFEILKKQEEYGWLADKPWIDKSIMMLEHWMNRIDRALGDRLPATIEVLETKTAGEYKYIKKPYLNSGKPSEPLAKWLTDGGMSLDDKSVAGPFTRILPRRISLNKAEEVKDYLLASGWIPDQWNTNSEGERTSAKLSKDDPFDGVQGSLGRLLVRFVQCKYRRAILQGWIRAIRPDGRIPSIVTNLAETGRATHKTIVNVPNADAFFGKWMRRVFIAPKGRVLVGTDSDGCQVRMLVARMNDPEYTDVVLNGDKDKGTDIHSVNMRAAGLDSRGNAKTFFYGFLFGAGDEKTGRIVGKGAAAGKELKAQFLQGLPKLAELLAKLTEEWRGNAKRRAGRWGRIEYYDGWIRGVDGRPIFIDSEHKILVYALQSDEAIMMAVAYCFLYKRLSAKYKWGEDFGIVNWNHDEYTVECREEIAKDIAAISAKCIVDSGKYLKIACPHAGQPAVGNNWYDIH